MVTTDMRPRQIGEILDAAIKLYKGNARTLMGSVAVVIVPLQLLYGFILLSTYSDPHDIAVGLTNFSGSALTPAEANARLGASGISFVIQIFGSSLVLAACVKALSDAYLGQAPAIGDSLRFGLRRMFPLVVQTIVRDIMLVIAFLLLIIPGIWLYPTMVASVPALVIERAGPLRSLRRSFRLVRKSWWHTATVVLSANLMVLLVTGLIEGALTAIALSTGSPSVLFVVAITVLASLVSSILIQPFGAAVITVLYYDLRIRREGYDIELLADQLGLPAGSLPPGPPTSPESPLGS